MCCIHIFFIQRTHVATLKTMLLQTDPICQFCICQLLCESSQRPSHSVPRLQLDYLNRCLINTGSVFPQASPEPHSDSVPPQLYPCSQSLQPRSAAARLRTTCPGSWSSSWQLSDFPHIALTLSQCPLGIWEQLFSLYLLSDFGELNTPQRPRGSSLENDSPYCSLL